MFRSRLIFQWEPVNGKVLKYAAVHLSHPASLKPLTLTSKPPTRSHTTVISWSLCFASKVAFVLCFCERIVHNNMNYLLEVWKPQLVGKLPVAPPPGLVCVQHAALPLQWNKISAFAQKRVCICAKACLFVSEQHEFVLMCEASYRRSTGCSRLTNYTFVSWKWEDISDLTYLWMP